MKIDKSAVMLVAGRSDDRTADILQAITEANEFEQYFGAPPIPEVTNSIKLNGDGSYNIYSYGEDHVRTLVGYIGTYYRYDDQHPDLEIYIMREHRRKGYASSALFMLLADLFFGSRKVPKIVASVRADNLASIKLLKSCGFEPETDKFCMFFRLDDNDELLTNPIELHHYSLTAEKFDQICGGMPS